MAKTPTPIWQNFSQVFKYGFRSQPLVLVIGISIVLTIFNSGFWGFAVSIILYAMLFKYAFVVLQQTSRGNMEPPALDSQTIASDYGLPLKFYGLILVYVFIASYLYAHGWETLGSLFVFMGLLLAPASIMVLALNESFIDALNPAMLWRLVVRIGWSYLALYGLIFVLQAARSNATQILAGGLHWGFYYFVSGYFIILTFHVMGYILYQNHELVGQPVEEDEDEISDQRFYHYQHLMEIGNVEAAIAELEQLVEEYPDDLDIHQRLHSLCLLEKREDKLSAHANAYLRLLLRKGKDAQAAEIYLDCLALHDPCMPEDAESYYRVAQALTRFGKHKQMVKLLNGLHKRFPRSDVVPHAYFLMARTLSESLNKDELAINTLNFLVENYSQHPVMPDVQAYLDVLRGDAR